MSQPPQTSADVVALAEELSAIRRRVLNVIGHELRTPATTLQGLAEEVCAATDLGVVTDELGPALQRNAARLMALLDQMLVAAGVQTAIPAGPVEAIDLAELLRGSWAVRGRGRLDVEGDGEVVHQPRAALAAAVDAVLDNAAQYGSGPPQALLTGLGDGVAVAIRSPGPAPHPEEVRLAREPFFRGERAVTTRPGLGLGLAIASAVLDHLGGDLRLSADGQVVTTTLTVPRGAAVAEAAE